MEKTPASWDILMVTTRMVVAYVANNTVSQETLPSLILEVYCALSSAGIDAKRKPMEELTPAVAINKSVFNDYLVCLEDGRHLQMLKRHLAVSYNMTPDQYRVKWKLPPDYPMVSPSYSRRRSSLAKSSIRSTRDRSK